VKYVAVPWWYAHVAVKHPTSGAIAAAEPALLPVPVPGFAIALPLPCPAWVSCLTSGDVPPQPNATRITRQQRTV